jgi:hypothetical protein
MAEDTEKAEEKAQWQETGRFAADTERVTFTVKQDLLAEWEDEADEQGFNQSAVELLIAASGTESTPVTWLSNPTSDRSDSSVSASRMSSVSWLLTCSSTAMTVDVTRFSP